MFSYIVGGFAVLVLLANPISQSLYPQSQHSHRGTRPQLNESLLAINGPNDTVPECAASSFTAHILKSQPLVVYLEKFLSDGDREELLRLSEPLFEPSTITNDGRATELDKSVRDSLVAMVPRSDTVRCIEARALSFQGWRRDVWLERLRTQRYNPGGHYGHHYDWTANSNGWGRVSSFMAWVDASEGLEGGGTEFPMLEVRGEDEICRFIECEIEEDPGDEQTKETQHKGTVFKVKPGNAVYWENFAADGRGFQETWHAGLPVEKGHKVGLNIWTYGRIE